MKSLDKELEKIHLYLYRLHNYVFIGCLSLFSTKSIVIAGLFLLGSLIIGITNILDKKWYTFIK